MRHEQLNKIETYDIVEPQSGRVYPELAVPDVPAAVGLMIVANYVLIVALFALTIASAGAAPFMIGVDLVFLAAFFSVPFIFLNMEPEGTRRPSLARFMATGMQTYTGHVTGGSALAQMFVVPASLALGVLAIGIIVVVGL